MTKGKKSVDPVRASRDGHEFHENWAARKSLQLVMPTDELVGIAIEGLDPGDQKTASKETVEIADLALYYGKGTTFNTAKSIHILQLKHSIGKESTPFRFSDAKKTLRKFASTFRDYKKKHGIKAVLAKLNFEVVTNRPISAKFQQALDQIQTGKKLTGDAKKQATNLKIICRMSKKELPLFAKAIRLTGLSGNLRLNKSRLSRALASWSGGHDPISRAWLGGMCQLLRDKAGIEGAGQNVIRKMDVLDALNVREDELFPCQEAFPEVGPVVEREQLSDALKIISAATTPYIIHATGGMGKTVFLQSIATQLSKEHEVYVFDCFGGGAYRSPEDRRHLPKRGIIHIVNNLAHRGLCDLLVPSNADSEDLIKTFRNRLAQAVQTLRTGSSDQKIFLFIDAADNAADFAKEQNQPCFPKLLLQSFIHGGPIPGVHLILSCRTERRGLVKEDLICSEYELKPFSFEETEAFLVKRVQNLKKVEIQVAYSRSEGCPRILEHLVVGRRGLLEPSEIGKVIKLNDVLEERIQLALGEAKKQGHKESEIACFLAGMAVLPPPVPVTDFAAAQRMDVSAINSFAVDLAPMLEKTKYGIWFRDEPTETLIRKKYREDGKLLQELADNLFKQQNKSVYAARALPRLLQTLGNGTMLMKLAFSDDFPTSITSTFGKQAIQYARLKAAVAYAASKKNYDQLIRLLVELSTIAASGEKGLTYIVNNPDLIVASQDIDSTRRLFEARTPWQGTRHARLAIAHILQNEPNEASRHAVQADQWIHHYFGQRDSQKPGPKSIDVAAIPLCIIGQGRYKDAISYLKRWKDWFAYEVTQHVFDYLAQSKSNLPSGPLDPQKFAEALDDGIAPLTAAASFFILQKEVLKPLLNRLSECCRKGKTIEANTSNRTIDEPIVDGILIVAAAGISLDLKVEALEICSAIFTPPPLLWTFMERYINPYSRNDLFPFLLHRTLKAAAEGRKLSGRDFLPRELHELISKDDNIKDEAELTKKLGEKLSELCELDEREKNRDKKISSETKSEAMGFLNERLPSCLKFLQPLRDLLASPSGRANGHFVALIKTWTEFRRNEGRYKAGGFNAFYDLFGQKLLLFSLAARPDLTADVVMLFIQEAEKGGFAASTLIEIVHILARRAAMHEIAGTLAKTASHMIEKDDDINSRSRDYSQLSRAILPASKDDAIKYFRTGLGQMDIVGSGDYEFINGLLGFCGAIHGETIGEKDFHTFTNLCELNMYEAGKYDWYAFGRALAKIAGFAGIAKLTRWDDRAKVPLEWSLMPFLAALVKDKKMAADLAVCLLRLCNPVSTWGFDFGDFTKLICENTVDSQKQLATELLTQFKKNHPSLPMSGIIEKLISICEPILGLDSLELEAFTLLKKHSERTVHEYNNNQNYRGPTDWEVGERAEKEKRKSKSEVEKIVRRTEPADAGMLCLAIEKFQLNTYAYDFKGMFFDGLREKLPFSARSKYVENIAGHDALNFFWKLEELKKCKDKWSASSSSIDDVFKGIAVRLLLKHSSDLIGHSSLSVREITDVSILCGIGMEELIINLITHFAAPDVIIPAAIWMDLAARLCPKATASQPQEALTRLLEGNAAKLSSNVPDGIWKQGLYPANDQNEITAAVIWFKLGSPAAADRWRAAHAVISLSKLGRWDVINLLFSKFSTSGAGPFQAPELQFYTLHACLWFLIALARIALDFPRQLSTHADALKSIAFDESFPHVLIRHFAGKVVESCSGNKNISLSELEKAKLSQINKSSYPPLQRKHKAHIADVWHRGRPEDRPEPNNSFSLDYDFTKYEVNSLCNVFAKNGWEIDDTITKWVRKFDAKIMGMHDAGGREKPGRRDSWGMTPKFHVYGEYLGWHALFLTAGTLLSQTPITCERNDDPWLEWLRRELLSRQDGLWLSDGTDSSPLETLVNLLEKGREVTGNREKVLGLLGIISPTIREEIVVDGFWISYDGIKVSISSSLVPSAKGQRLAKKMSKLEPYDIWVPHIEQYESEYVHNEKLDFRPWIVSPSKEARLDENDPLGSVQAIVRLYFAEQIRQQFQLKSTDTFDRSWQDHEGVICSVADAWGGGPPDREERSPQGHRLRCAKVFLKKVLAIYDEDLLITIKLERYESAASWKDSKLLCSTAVVRIDKMLDWTYYGGRINWTNKEGEL